MFENTFNSELRECLQNYTAIEAYFVKYTIIDDKDFIKKYMLETILHQQEILQLLNEKKLPTQEVQSNTVQVSNVNSVVMENTSFGKEKGNLKTAFNNSAKESSLDSETKDVHAIKYKMSKAKQRCMEYFRSLYQTTSKYFVEYTGIQVKHLRDTLLQHMGNVKKSVAERTQSSDTESEVQDTSSRSRNDTDADDADIIYDEELMDEIQSHKTRNNNKPIDHKSHTQKPGRQIFTGHRFFPNKTFAVYEKTSPRSDLMWKPIVEFLNLLVLGGFLHESYSTLARARVTVNPHMVPM
nr:hypothetical protein [Tanacetum cinerariifolium]